MSTNYTDTEGKILTNNSNEVILSTGTSNPTGTGYAPGAIHINTSTGAIAINAGTTASASFATEAGSRVATVNLTSAQVKALRATPFTLVAAPGAGKINIVESVTLQLNYGGTNAFTESADNLVVEYGDSGQDITASIETTGFIDQTSDRFAIVYPATIATMATATVGVNETIQLFNTGDGEIAGNAANDNTLNVTVAYRTVSIV